MCSLGRTPAPTQNCKHLFSSLAHSRITFACAHLDHPLKLPFPVTACGAKLRSCLGRVAFFLQHMASPLAFCAALLMAAAAAVVRPSLPSAMPRRLGHAPRRPDVPPAASSSTPAANPTSSPPALPCWSDSPLLLFAGFAAQPQPAAALVQLHSMAAALFACRSRGCLYMPSCRPRQLCRRRAGRYRRRSGLQRLPPRPHPRQGFALSPVVSASRAPGPRASVVASIMCSRPARVSCIRSIAPPLWGRCLTAPSFR